jgi:cyclophilin family peptidyl-prolyl cis-trans isomerase
MRFLRGVFFLSLVFFLTGCSTDEVRKQELVTSDFKLDSEKEAEKAKAAEEAAKVDAEKKAQAEAAKQAKQKAEPMFKEAPIMDIDAATKSYEATLKTSKGDITIALQADKTPITVNNFVFLSRKNFYNNTPFHRTIKDFMIQGGDPTGTGTGGPGYKFNDESFTGEYTRGTVAMANSGPNTNGSQFFIMHKDTALPKNYVIFGTVTKGMEVVDMIATAPTKPGGEGSSPVDLAYVQSVTIQEKIKDDKKKEDSKN